MTLPVQTLTLSQTDLQRLIDDKVREGPHIDFKRELPAAWDDKSKHRLLADVVAFANAGGGDLLFGVDENADAEAVAIVPQVVGSIDVEVRKLQDFILTLSDPRVPAVQVHAISVEVASVKGHVLLVRVAQSWAGPHRVKTNQHFYVRDGLRNRQLDIPEVRALFLRSDSVAQKMRDFRTERLARIVTGATPSPMAVGPKLVLHVIPTQAALGLVQVDPVPYETYTRKMPFVSTISPSTIRLNLDGAVGSHTPDRETNSAYVQLFRTGQAEMVWRPGRIDGPSNLPSIAFERYVLQFTERFRTELKELGFSTSLTIMFTLLGANAATFEPQGRDGFPMSGPGFDRDALVLPDVLIEEETPVHTGLRPVFDLVWQSAGFAKSENYTDKGEWSPPSRY